MSKTIEEMADREILRYAVQREIFCPATGKILDVRATRCSSWETGSRPVSSPPRCGTRSDTWPWMGCADAGLTPEVYDGTGAVLVRALLVRCQHDGRLAMRGVRGMPSPTSLAMSAMVTPRGVDHPWGVQSVWALEPLA